ncbi:hypothetical protein L208DRAFT_1393274 [Tricholoma matsutake]|nr:hypothetical protein L208DRAFT_1424990 [Tricholoma matsutake 945]KAF8234846.1 hypothetical protein L208DRAFT_1393274 [Tricholoma matsutake 945]
MDTIENIEEYLESVENYFFSSLSAATTDMPNVQEAVNRLWLDISRYGPGMPEIHLPSLGNFQVPPPPPPPPPPPHLTWLSRSADCIGRHPWTTSAVVIGVAGAGLLLVYRTIGATKRNKYRIKTTSERQQVVVVLGGDTPLALPLIRGLEKKGFVVIASVATPEAVEALERRCQGFVKALVLDPHEPATVPVFLRSLASTLSRKFPITAAGDPFASPTSHLYIHSIISLLTLPTSTLSVHAPLEHISLRNTYLPYLNATHITPLQVIQALMPLLRTGPARSRDKGKKSIIVCLPAIDARVGLPFASMQAMSAAGTLRGVEVLRREINVASLTDKSESMKNIRVVVADVGLFDVDQPSSNLPPDSIYKAMEDWSPSEKVTYGPAFASILHDVPPPASRFSTFSHFFKSAHRYTAARRPTDASVFVDNIVSLVTEGRHGATLFGLGVGLNKLRNWIRGERFSIGAGANTYRIASHLPSLILDGLLNVPYILISIRNRILPVEPFLRRPPDFPLPPPVAPKRASTTNDNEGHERDESGNERSETNSEADVESNASESWISLHGAQGEGHAGEE